MGGAEPLQGQVPYGVTMSAAGERPGGVAAAETAAIAVEVAGRTDAPAADCAPAPDGAGTAAISRAASGPAPLAASQLASPARAVTGFYAAVGQHRLTDTGGR